MMKRPILWAVLVAMLALGACGGGSDSPVADAVPADTVPGEPTPPSPVAVDRIEPLDTATLARAVQAKAAQVVASRMPVGAVTPRVALGPLESVKAARDDVLKIGQGRVVDATASVSDLAGMLRWNKLTDGSQVAALAFSSDGARAIRLGVLARQLPAGAVLRFYGESGTAVVEMSAAQIEAMRDINEAGGLTGDAARTVWGPDTDGAVSTLEVQLPAASATSQLQLAVPQLSHLTQSIDQAANALDTADIGAAGPCNLDVMCTADLQAESRAVAKLLFVDQGDAYVCSGTLMNDIHNSLTPYFMTAAHCISGQAAASSAITYWFFRAASCNSSPVYDPAMTRIASGAQLLYTDVPADQTLLQLNSPPPDRVVYAGSYYSSPFGPGAVPSADVLGVHHPKGDLQKYSVGIIQGYSICGTNGCAPSSAESGNMYTVGWLRGTTEPGSSGSPLFTTLGVTHYVIGALSRGAGSCRNLSGKDFYSRINRSSLDTGIQDWLMH
ncbi:MAG: trypsin-like peptidase domain-containing protein [Burkholderiaceae bacterium]|jgi:hypothetical protein|nr:trypsin-like peptidase domain-containing protein [Burkholderiaceae bacterium]